MPTFGAIPGDSLPLMRSGKAILLASKKFAGEDRLRSWLEILGTVFLAAMFFVGTIFGLTLEIQILCSVGCGVL